MNIRIISSMLAAMMLFASCTKKLDRVPEQAFTNEVLFKTEAGYRSALAKIYGGLALTGNSANGGAGSPDITSITDEGFSSYLRIYWYMQELPTDEAVIGWDDKTIKSFHNMSWNSADEFIGGMYSRLFFQITLANNFIQEAADDKLSSRGISGADADKVKAYRAEARFLRALSYWHALDLYANPILVTDKNPIGAFTPEQSNRVALFNYVEGECKELESLLPAPKTNEYARADRAALWMLMANLYLNAEVYTGTARWADAASYSKKVIDAGYTLNSHYGYNFLADNHTSPEIIFPVAFDGDKTRSYGGTNFLIHAPVGGKMKVADFGIDFGWGGLRTTSAFVNKFPDTTGTGAGDYDRRMMFFVDSQKVVISDIGSFYDGYAIQKWKNITSAGAPGKNATFVDTDFPMFRLSEAYLIYAEAMLKVSPLNNSVALEYVNKVRRRGYGFDPETPNIKSDFTTIDFNKILDERARELYWEGKRRQDLIRYGLFTTSTYLWPWKGGAPSGKSVESFRNIYPIPAPELNANPALKQNTGY
ncbi:MAG: RagB/SusD family nutrient uptake outer membrane protein [Sphingobacteriales bacterium]